MQECKPFCCRQLFGFVARLADIRPVQHDSRTERAAVAHLDQRGKLGHHDRHWDVQQTAVVSHPQRMIAGRGGDHAASPLLCGKPLQRVARAAFLEATRALQIVELAEDVRAGKL